MTPADFRTTCSRSTYAWPINGSADDITPDSQCPTKVVVGRAVVARLLGSMPHPRMLVNNCVRRFCAHAAPPQQTPRSMVLSNLPACSPRYLQTNDHQALIVSMTLSPECCVSLRPAMHGLVGVHSNSASPALGQVIFERFSLVDKITGPGDPKPTVFHESAALAQQHFVFPPDHAECLLSVISLYSPSPSL
jgi:hypothetical protein